MRLFLDTEFTDLKPGAKLISIALVDDNGEYFYAELTDTYELKDCSVFVKSHVLPYLDNEENVQMTWNECAEAIGNWIDDRSENCILACDNPSWDVPYLKALLKDCWPQNLEYNLFFPVAIMDVIKNDIIEENNFRIHNSLDDAKVMRLATIRQGR